MSITVDIEASNRCNAVCHFCPRDATPHQGHMSMEVFEQTLKRLIELRDYNDIHAPGFTPSPNICGLGEPLLNPNTPEFIRRIRAEGFSTCNMSSNGALLDQRRGDAVLEAGVTRVNINISDLGADYQEIYNLPYEVTRDNIIRFVKDSRGSCEVHIVLVDHHQDPSHIKQMRRFWRQHGVDGFMEFDVMNRGGALFVDHMQYEQYDELRRAQEIMSSSGVQWVCAAPFLFLFVGYDGNYYLCCSDWKKEAPVASVFDTAFMSVTEQKLRHVTSREPVCKTCNHDPQNIVAGLIRDMDNGLADRDELEQVVAKINTQSTTIHAGVVKARELSPQVMTTKLEKQGQRLIPVVSV